MVNNVAKVSLPVDEELLIVKNSYKGKDNNKRISIVTGIHGDELEGQYVCYEINNRIKANKEALKGCVDIYPALNPFGIDTIMRGIPAFDLDMNRIFPGRLDGDMNESLAADIIKDVSGSDLVIDIHASNMYLTEVPQIRINELHKDVLLPFAKKANVDFIWVHSNATVLESTFAYSLNAKDTPTLVVEMGIGMRITKEYGNQLCDGIFELMKELDIWDESKVSSPVKNEPVNVTTVISDGYDDVYFLNAEAAGIFIKEKNHGELVNKGDLIGRIVSPLTGDVLKEVTAPGDGWLFTIREYPLVMEGTLTGRILKKEVYDNFREGK